MDKVRNSIIRERCSSRRSFLNRLDHSILKWFRHLERMDEGRLSELIYVPEGEVVEEKCGEVEEPGG